MKTLEDRDFLSPETFCVHGCGRKTSPLSEVYCLRCWVRFTPEGFAFAAILLWFFSFLSGILIGGLE